MTREEDEDLIDTMSDALEGKQVCRECMEKDTLIRILNRMNEGLQRQVEHEREYANKLARDNGDLDSHGRWPLHEPVGRNPPPKW